LKITSTLKLLGYTVLARWATYFAVDDDVDRTFHNDVPRFALIALTKHCITLQHTTVQKYSSKNQGIPGRARLQKN